MSYGQFLAWLLAFGQLMPQLLLLVQEAAAKLQEAAELVRGTLPQQLIDPTHKELDLESQVALVVAGSSGAWDGSKLRAAFKFLSDSGLLPLLLTMLTKTATGG